MAKGMSLLGVAAGAAAAAAMGPAVLCLVPFLIGGIIYSGKKIAEADRDLAALDKYDSDGKYRG
jgi:hypothetical protein